MKEHVRRVISSALVLDGDGLRFSFTGDLTSLSFSLASLWLSFLSFFSINSGAVFCRRGFMDSIFSREFLRAISETVFCLMD